MTGRRQRGKAWLRTLSGAIAWLMLAAMPATAADAIRIAAQKTGTLAWELAVIRAHGFDGQASLEIVTTDLATPKAGKIALRAGSVDVIVRWFAIHAPGGAKKSLRRTARGGENKRRTIVVSWHRGPVLGRRRVRRSFGAARRLHTSAELAQ